MEKYKINENRIIIRGKRNILILLLTGITSIGWISLNIVIFIGIIEDPHKVDAFMIIFMLAYNTLGLLFLEIFLWHLIGREKIELTDKNLIIKNKGSIISFPKRLELENISNIKVARKYNSPYWMRLWGLAGGKIEINYFGNKIYFGQSLNNQEGEKIVEKLKLNIKNAR